jgi:hypothetical protein
MIAALRHGPSAASAGARHVSAKGLDAAMAPMNVLDGVTGRPPERLVVTVVVPLAAHRAIAVRCGETQIKLLPGSVAKGLRQRTDKALDARRPLNDLDYFCVLPADVGRQVEWPINRLCIVARATIPINVIASEFPEAWFIHFGKL